MLPRKPWWRGIAARRVFSAYAAMLLSGAAREFASLGLR
jgi:hypothetical protein